MVFLLAVLLTAVSFGIWPAIYASVLSFLVYNFFFIEPLYTFTIAEPYELLALVIFPRRGRHHLRAGRPRARAGEDIGRPHAGDAPALRIHPPAVGAGDARRRGRRRGQRNPRQPRPRGRRPAGAGRRSDVDRRLAAGRCARRRADDGGALGLSATASRPAPTPAHLPIIPWYFVPLRIGDKTLGVIGVAKPEGMARSIRKRARCSIRCRSKPPRRWIAPRWRAKW